MVTTALCFASSGGDYATLVERGESALCNEDWVRAAGHFRDASVLCPDSLQAHRLYQDACLSGGDSLAGPMRSRYVRLAQRHPSDARYQYLCGRSWSCGEGDRYFDAALEADKCYAWALCGRGACRYERGELDSAKVLFLEAIRCNANFAEAYHNLARVYLDQGKDKLAKKAYRRLIAEDRRNVRVYEWLGDMYLQQEHYHFAALAYERAIEGGGRSAYIRFKLGYSHFKEGRLDAAVKEYRRSVAGGYSACKVYYNLGAVLELTNQPESALDNYERAYTCGGDCRVLYSMGNCAVQLGLHSKAIECYQQFLQCEPTHKEALVGLANAFRLRREYLKAVEIYESVLAVDDRYAKAYYNLGSIYAYDLRAPEKARGYWQRYVELFPANDDVEYITKEMDKICPTE